MLWIICNKIKHLKDFTFFPNKFCIVILSVRNSLSSVYRQNIASNCIALPLFCISMAGNQRYCLAALMCLITFRWASLVKYLHLNYRLEVNRHSKIPGKCASPLYELWMSRNVFLFILRVWSTEKRGATFACFLSYFKGFARTHGSGDSCHFHSNYCLLVGEC